MEPQIDTPNDSQQVPSKYSWTYIFENGYYIPLFYPLVYWYIPDHLIATTIILKLLATNYYIHFGKFYDYSNHCPSITKAFVRLTDTGYLATLMAYLYPSTFPVAFNIHFMLTISFFFATQVLGMKDMDGTYPSPTIDSTFAETWMHAIHTLPFLFFCYQLIANPQNKSFTFQTFYQSIAWVLAWFVFIYIPFRLITGDCVYSILAADENRWLQMAVVALVFVVLFVSNWIGQTITTRK